jgi:hypothetical protein
MGHVYVNDFPVVGSGGEYQDGYDWRMRRYWLRWSLEII